MGPLNVSFGVRTGRIFTLLLLAAFTSSAYAGRPVRIDFSSALHAVQGDMAGYLQDGSGAGLTVTQEYCNGITAGIGLDHARYGHQSDLGTRIDSNRTRMGSTTISAGAGYGYRLWKTVLNVYGRSGLSFIAAPAIETVYPGTDLVINRLRAYDGTALSTAVGAGVTFEPCSGISLFLKYELSSLLNSGFTTETRDISTAVNAIGLIDPDLAADIPFTAKDLSLTTRNLAFGISIALGSGGTKAQDYNSSRSNNSGIVAPDTGEATDQETKE